MFRDVDMQVFNVKWVQTVMKTVNPVLKSDDFCDFIEETGYSTSLSKATNLHSQIPTILARHFMELLYPLITNKVFFPIIFDGTTCVTCRGIWNYDLMGGFFCHSPEFD